MKPSDLLATHREAIRQVVAAHRRDTEASDLDLLIDPTDATTLFDIGAIMGELNDLLGIPVDVVTPNALPEEFRDQVLAEALPV
jgi:hypothetical protein